MPHKKGHTWKDAAGDLTNPNKWKDALGGKIINKGKLAISKKVKEMDSSDKNPINKIKNRKITENVKKGNAKGQIQKKLLKSGFSKTQLRKIGEKDQAFKKNRKKMDEMRKSNPERYKKLKKEQRRKANAKALKSNSSTWD